MAGDHAATLTFYAGVMGAGKSSLALLLDHNWRKGGRDGILLVTLDRSGRNQLSSRLGITADARAVGTETDLYAIASALHPGNFIIVDEAQFLHPEQIEQLARACDDLAIDIHAFGITTDFRSKLFPGAQRLIELADRVIPLQVEVLCWCGQPGRQNARIENGHVARDGDVVAIGDINTGEITYQVLCRKHWRDGRAQPATANTP